MMPLRGKRSWAIGLALVSLSGCRGTWLREGTPQGCTGEPEAFRVDRSRTLVVLPPQGPNALRAGDGLQGLVAEVLARRGYLATPGTNPGKGGAGAIRMSVSAWDWQPWLNRAYVAVTFDLLTPDGEISWSRRASGTTILEPARGNLQGGTLAAGASEGSEPNSRVNRLLTEAARVATEEFINDLSPCPPDATGSPAVPGRPG